MGVPSLLADFAVAALVEEASLTPKPGLVDMHSRGAHGDLDWALMCHSARSLYPAFHAMARAAGRINDMQSLREHIGYLGREAEVVMMKATGGVNTHRGAIWALGLLVTAAAQNTTALSPRAVAARAGAIACRDDRHAPAVTGNKGERACRAYGVGGARAQAQAGFPHVVGVALPYLQVSRCRKGQHHIACLDALLAVIARLDDTCVLARGGREALAWLQAAAARILVFGGVGNTQGYSALIQLTHDAVARNISPGGAADLLAAALFLNRLGPRSAN